MNLPGSFNSLSGSLETLYSDFKAIPFLFQTQAASSSLSAQFDMGIRAFDLGVNVVAFTESDHSKKNTHYHCSPGTLPVDPLNCLDFRLMTDVFPLSNERFQSVMTGLLTLLKDNPTETILLRLTCEPDIACDDNWDVLRVFESMKRFHQPLDQFRGEHKLVVVDSLHDRLLGEARGKVLMTVKSFPEGFNYNFWDLCMPGYDLQQSQWVTYSSTSSYFYEIDRVQQRDTYMYSPESEVRVHDLAEWTLLLSRHSDSLQSIDHACTRVLTTHAGSYTLSPKVFHAAFKDLALITILGLNKKVGLVFQDFVTTQDALSLVGASLSSHMSYSLEKHSYVLQSTTTIVKSLDKEYNM